METELTLEHLLVLVVAVEQAAVLVLKVATVAKQSITPAASVVLLVQPRSLDKVVTAVTVPIRPILETTDPPSKAVAVVEVAVAPMD